MAPTTGAWTSEDPVLSEGRYTYVGGMSSALVDPSGKSMAGAYGFLTCFGAGAAYITVGFITYTSAIMMPSVMRGLFGIIEGVLFYEIESIRTAMIQEGSEMLMIGGAIWRRCIQGDRPFPNPRLPNNPPPWR